MFTPEIDGALGQPQARIPGYELVEEIGSGGSAVVYRAQQTSADRHVAVKILRRGALHGKAAIRRFEREARIIGRLRHPNTIRLYDIGRTKSGELYLVTELLVGRSLAEVLREGAFTPQRVVTIAKQIAGSLAEAHHAGIVHRDIKPANIFLDRIGDDDIVKVLDFGIASEMTNTQISRSDFVVGSPVYMAPEQVSSGEIDHRADIYALGVLLHHALSGQPPFVAATTQEMLAMHLTRAPLPIWIDRTDLSDAHLELEQLVLDMLQKSPAARPQTMSEIRARLDRIGAMLGGAGEAEVFDTVEDELPIANMDTQWMIRECTPGGRWIRGLQLELTRAKGFLRANALARAGILMFAAAIALAATATLITAL